jgi:hypothetical protein
MRNDAGKAVPEKLVCRRLLRTRPYATCQDSIAMRCVFCTVLKHSELLDLGMRILRGFRTKPGAGVLGTP